MNLKLNFYGIWVFFGDFNVVRKIEETFNSFFCKYTTTYFNDFIIDARLKEFKMGGMKYTFFRE